MSERSNLGKPRQTRKRDRSKSVNRLASGEGERRAVGGLVPQWDLAARVVYQALAAETLEWVGLADRGAGSFDDVVLGLHGKVIAYQVKTTRDPGAFNAKTVLLGAKGLWRKIVESRRELGVFPQNVPIETVYVCDDSPGEDDDVGGGAQRISSAQLLQALADNRLRWNLTDWRCSLYAALVDELRAGAGLSDGEFETVWRNLHFVTSRDGRTLGIPDPSDGDVRRIREIANCIPRLVAESGKKNRWTKSELLRELGWRDPSILRHSGQFPVDGLFQANSATQRFLQKVLATVSSGYASLNPSVPT